MSSNSPRDAIEDFASAFKTIFKKYSKGARDQAWHTLMSPKGRDEIKSLSLNPDKSLNGFKTLPLSFREWYNKNS